MNDKWMWMSFSDTFCQSKTALGFPSIADSQTVIDFKLPSGQFFTAAGVSQPSLLFWVKKTCGVPPINGCWDKFT